MRTMHYKGYFLMFEWQHNGIVAVADNDNDRFRYLFCNDGITYAIKKMKELCTYRLSNNIKEGYTL